MKKRNLVLTVVFCLFLILGSFFSALFSENVMADDDQNTTKFYYRANGNGLQIFVNENSNSNTLRISKIKGYTEPDYYSFSKTRKNVYEDGNLSLQNFTESAWIYYYAFGSDAYPNKEVEFESVNSLFNDINQNVILEGNDLTLDFAKAFDYGFNNSIEIKINDSSTPVNSDDFEFDDEKLTIKDIDWKLGNNKFSVKFYDLNYTYDFIVTKYPEITNVKIGNTVLSGKSVGIVSGSYDFSFDISPISGLKKTELTICDVTADREISYNSSTSNSTNQKFTVDLTNMDGCVGHDYSYEIRITDNNNKTYTFKNGQFVTEQEDPRLSSFSIVSNHNLVVDFASNNENAKTVAKKDDSFSVKLSSDEDITGIVARIEGVDIYYPEGQEDEESWSVDEDVFSYSGTVTSVNSLRYLNAYIAVSYEDGTDCYDTLSFDNTIILYPDLSVSVNSYSTDVESKKLTVSDSFTAYIKYNKSQQNNLSPELSISSFQKSLSSNDEDILPVGESSIAGLAATIEMSDVSSFCTENQAFSFYMTLCDKAGNTCSVKINPSDYTYYGPFTTDGLRLDTSNANTYTDESGVEYQYVNNDDRLSICFTSNHNPIDYSITFPGMNYDIKGRVYEGSVTPGCFIIELDNITNYGLVSGKPVDLDIFLSDINGAISTTEIDLQNIIYLGDFTIAHNSDDFKDVQYLTMDDSINLTFSASDLESSGRDVKISSISLDYTNETTDQFHYIDSWSNEDGTFESIKSKTIPMSVLSDINPLINPDYLKLQIKINLEDRSGNSAEATIDTNCYYYRSIDKSISKVNITNSHDSSVAKVGDTLTLSFNCTHPLGSKNDVDASGNRILKGTLNGDAVTFTSSDGLIWTAEFTVSENNKWNDNSGIDLYLELYDESDNEHYVMTNKDVSNPMVYYSPISISNFIFKSDNTNAEGKLANDNDKITLSFDSTHQLKVENAYIADKKVELTETVSDGVYSYATTCNVSDLEIEDNNPVSFKFDLNDQAGNETYHLDYESTKISVIYQAPIELSETSIISSNDNDKYLAKDGNYITVEFETTHPVNIVSATVAGNDLTLKSRDNDKMHWSGTYLVTNNIVSDNGKINVRVEVGDDSGNDNIVLSSDDIMYYAPLTVSSATISTDNSNDSTKYAIDGNNVVVSFITNHKIATSSSSFSLAGRSGLSVSEEALSNGSYKYTFSRKIANGELSDLSVVGFDLSVTDIAGNSVVSLNEKSSGVINSITYYSPLTITTSIESSGSNSNYAKNGDTVTVKATVNHAATATSASLLDKSMGVSGNESTSITLTYTISTAESSMKEGTLSASLNFADVAGNTLSVTEINSGSVIYDRTKPSIDVSNGFSGFSADDITFDISIADSNIDKDKTTVDVNGTIRKIGSGLEADGTTYSTVVKNEEDGTLTVTISAVDLAGNSATPVKYTVTIDKSNPTVTTTTLYSTSNKLFKPGLVVAELFEINEENMSEITCTVSDGSSVYDWDINTPLDTDGKKTISIIAVDKAGNASEQLVFDLYIDGTAPNPILTDKIANKVLSVGTNEFNDPTTIVFSLQDLAYNPDEPDKFTKILVTCPDGSVVDILADNSVNSDGEYFYDFSEYGTYSVVLEAEDELGNATGEIKYEINIKEKPLDALKRAFSTDDGEGGTKFNYKKAAIIGGGSLAGVALIATCVVFLIRRKRIR